MKGYGVVLTTYDSCVAAFTREKGQENWLYETEWKRIMIDEGHIIKNDKFGFALIFIAGLLFTRPSCRCAEPSTG